MATVCNCQCRRAQGRQERLIEVIRADFRIKRAVRLLNENSSRTLADLASGCTLSISGFA